MLDPKEAMIQLADIIGFSTINDQTKTIFFFLKGLQQLVKCASDLRPEGSVHICMNVQD